MSVRNYHTISTVNTRTYYIVVISGVIKEHFSQYAGNE